MPAELLRDTHQRVFRGFRYATDKTRYGLAEYWDNRQNPDRVHGDCDEFALTCYRLLLESGLGQARLVMCQTETGEWHLVCTADHYVLDNRHPRVMTKGQLERLGYVWHAMNGGPEDTQWRTVQ